LSKPMHRARAKGRKSSLIGQIDFQSCLGPELEESPYDYRSVSYFPGESK